MPGDIPFYFDEIRKLLLIDIYIIASFIHCFLFLFTEAISPVVESGSNPLVYAVFNTPVNAIPGSAVCAFNVDDIMETFQGRFKSQKDSQSQWLPVQEEQVPEPRPGQCVEDSRTLSSIAVNFVKNHPLMEMSVPAVFARPLLTKVNLHNRLTTIAIDPQVRALNGEFHDVIYTGTDDGKITKFINIPTASNGGTSNSIDNLKTVLISELQVLPVGMPVRELVVSTKANTLLVVSDGSLVTVPLHHCALIVDCSSCLGLQDPNCAWDQQTHECKSLNVANHKFGTKTFLQSLNTTKKAAKNLCPKSSRGTVIADGPVINLGAVTDNNLDAQSNTQVHIEDDLAKKHLYNNMGSIDAVNNPVIPDISSPELDLPTAMGGDFLLNNFNDENKITLHSVDPHDLMNSVNGEFKNEYLLEFVIIFLKFSFRSFACHRYG